MTIFFFFLLCVFSLFQPPGTAAAVWQLDPDHSAAHFAVSHMDIATVRGSFAGMRGSGEIDEKNGTLRSLVLELNAAAVSSGVAKRDQHLKSPDFLDSAKHPRISFVAKKILDLGERTLEIEGEASIHGITRTVRLMCNAFKGPVTDPAGHQRMGGRAFTVLSRREFGIQWNERLPGGIPVIGDAVDVIFDLEFIRPKK